MATDITQESMFHTGHDQDDDGVEGSLQSAGETSGEGIQPEPSEGVPLGDLKQLLPELSPLPSRSQSSRQKHRDMKEKSRESPVSHVPGDLRSPGAASPKILSPSRRIYKVPSRVRRHHHHTDGEEADADGTSSPKSFPRRTSTRKLSQGLRDETGSPPASPTPSTTSGSRYRRPSKSVSHPDDMSTMRRRQIRSKSHDRSSGERTRSKSRDPATPRSPGRHRSKSRDKSSANRSSDGRSIRSSSRERPDKSPLRRPKGSVRPTMRKVRTVSGGDLAGNSLPSDQAKENSQRSSRTLMSTKTERSRVRSKAALENSGHTSASTKSRMRRSHSSDAERRRRRSQSRDPEKSSSRQRSHRSGTSKSPKQQMRRRLSKATNPTDPGTPGSVRSRKTIELPLTDKSIPPPPPPPEDDDDDDDDYDLKSVQSAPFGPSQSNSQVSKDVPTSPSVNTEGTHSILETVRQSFRRKQHVDGGTTHAISSPRQHNKNVKSPSVKKQSRTLDDLLGSQEPKNHMSFNSLPEESVLSGQKSPVKNNVRSFLNFGNKSAGNLLANHFRNNNSNPGGFSALSVSGGSLGSSTRMGGDDSSEGTGNMTLRGLRRSRSYGDVTKSSNEFASHKSASARSLRPEPDEDFFFHAKFDATEGSDDSEEIVELDDEDGFGKGDEEIDSSVRVVRNVLPKSSTIGSLGEGENDSTDGSASRHGEYLQLALPTPQPVEESESEFTEASGDLGPPPDSPRGLLQRFAGMARKTGSNQP